MVLNRLVLAQDEQVSPIVIPRPSHPPGLSQAAQASQPAVSPAVPGKDGRLALCSAPTYAGAAGIIKIFLGNTKYYLFLNFNLQAESAVFLGTLSEGTNGVKGRLVAVDAQTLLLTR